MAGESGGRKRGESPGAQCGSGTLEPLPPLRNPVAERPLTLRRSPRLHLQKENVPLSPLMSPMSPLMSPGPPPPSPPPPAVAPRVRRSYSRLEPLGTPRGPPLSPIPPPAPCAPQNGPGAPPERRRKKKLPPIDAVQLEAWAAAMNQQFEEAERFRLVIE